MSKSQEEMKKKMTKTQQGKTQNKIQDSNIHRTIKLSDGV